MWYVAGQGRFRYFCLKIFDKDRYEKKIMIELLTKKVLDGGSLDEEEALLLAKVSQKVELSNLQRQIIHFTPDVGRPKVESAAEKICLLNPYVRVEAHRRFLRADNALELVSRYDFIVDGTDNFPTKFLINDACVMAGKPFSHGGILRFEGETFTHLPGTACYRCLFEAPPPAGAVPTCLQAGVLGAIAGMLGTIQAAEALKYLTGAGELLTDRLLTFDAKRMKFRTLRTSRHDGCPVCGTHPTVTRLVDDEQAVCETKKK